MLESQFYSLGQVCLAGQRLCFDRLQCVDAWMMYVGLVEFSETLFMTYVNKQNLFSGSSSLSSWKIEFRKSLITLHNSVNIGIQHQFHLKWSMLQTFWKLGQSSMHLKSPVSLTGFEGRIQSLYYIITLLYLQHCTSLATVTLQDSKLVLLVLPFEDSFGTCMDTKSWLLQIEVQCHCEQRPYPHVYHNLPVALGHPLECIEWEINIHIFQYLSEVVLNQ